MNKPSILGKTIILLTLSFILVAKGNNTRTISKINEAKIQIQANKPKDLKSEAENPPIIKENTVVFLSLSSEDYKALISKDPAREDMLVEVLSDFIFYADKVAVKLKALGITSEVGHWKELLFQLADGKTEKLIFDPEDVFGLALYAKGKSPVMVRSTRRPEDMVIGQSYITPDFFSMAEVISEYFGVKIEW